MKINKQIVVVGASGFGRESLDVLQAMQAHDHSIAILGVVDDEISYENHTLLKSRHIPYLGTINQWLDTHPIGIKYLLGIGNPAIRRQLVEKLDNEGLSAFTAVHPSAVIGSQLSISEGTVICAGAVISTNVHCGRHVHVNPSATIGHDARLEDFVSINPSAVISGEVRLERGVLVGAGAVVLQQLIVGADATVGAAALVTKSVPPKAVAMGVPARW